MPTTDQLRHIATQVGVSLSTVYRVLNGDIKGKRRDNAAKAQSIRSIASQLGYRPNAAAKAMSSGRFNCVALALVASSQPDRDFMHQGTFTGIQMELQEHAMHLAVGGLDAQSLLEREAEPRFLSEWLCDGLLLNYSGQVPPHLLQLVRTQGLPAVWLNVDLPYDTVNLDDQQGASLATTHLVQLGHQRILYLQLHGSTHYSVNARRNGYIAALQRPGLATRAVSRVGGIATSERLAFVRDLLTGPDRPTAIVGYGPDDALTAATAALSLGLSIPRDLSIVAIHDTILDTNGFVYTTAFADTREIGRRAVNMVLEKIGNPAVQLPTHSVAYQLEPGTTTAPAPR
jgi:DNA-binding LacI/PurR family transcriptional regulator